MRFRRGIALVLLAACSAAGPPAEVDAVKQRFGGYTVARAEQEGYVRDRFCLDATSFVSGDNLRGFLSRT